MYKCSITKESYHSSKHRIAKKVRIFYLFRCVRQLYLLQAVFSTGQRLTAGNRIHIVIGNSIMQARGGVILVNSYTEI